MDYTDHTREQLLSIIHLQELRIDALQNSLKRTRRVSKSRLERMKNTLKKVRRVSKSRLERLKKKSENLRKSEAVCVQLIREAHGG
jgi:uncharacterized protein YktB (UPF0637 family)